MARRSIPSSGPTRRTSWPRSGGLASHWSWPGGAASRDHGRDRKSTRLNSSHSQISYAVFCLKKKSQSFGVAVYPRRRLHVKEPIELDQPKALGGYVFNAIQQLIPAVKDWLHGGGEDGEWAMH